MTDDCTAVWTWASLEQAALHDPTLQHLVTLVALGRITQEQAAIGAALLLWQANANLRASLVEEISNRVRPILLTQVP